MLQAEEKINEENKEFEKQENTEVKQTLENDEEPLENEEEINEN